MDVHEHLKSPHSKVITKYTADLQDKITKNQVCWNYLTPAIGPVVASLNCAEPGTAQLQLVSYQ